MRRASAARPAAFALLLSSAACSALAASDAPAPADAGEAIYLQGQGSAGRPVTARHTAGGWRLRGAVVACANCHGLQREGGREGAVPAPSLRWVDATPATRSALHAALSRGRGRDGRALDATMPRFELEAPEFEALQSYLYQANAGIRRPAALPLYVSLLPEPEHRLPVEQALLAGLQDCLGAMAAGPVPTLRWQVLTYASAAQALAQWRAALQSPGIAAVVAPSLRGWKDEWAAAVLAAGAGAQHWPSVLYPLVDDPVTSDAEGPAGPAGESGKATASAPVTWLFGGPAQQRLALQQVRQQRAPPVQHTSAEPAGQPPASRAPGYGTAEPGTRWVAVPALAGTEPARSGRSLGALWAEAACTTVQALQQRARDAPAALAREPVQHVRWALQHLGRLETAAGLLLEPDRPIAVNDWSVWELGLTGPPRLIEPRARLERNVPTR